ncbi:MAG: hypothetical protein WBP58_08240 [Chitinophagaceae bacterium]
MGKLIQNDLGEYCYIFNAGERIRSFSEKIRDRISLISLKEVGCEIDYSKLDFCTRLNIFDSDLRKCQLTGIVALHQKLQYLNLIDSDFPVYYDFSKFTRLLSLELNWHKTYSNLNMPSLVTLILRKLKGKLPIQDLSGLKVLELIQGSVNSLIGIEKLTQLRSLVIYRTRNMAAKEFERLEGLEHLEYLHIAGCKDLIDLRVFFRCKSLKWVDLENCTNVFIANDLVVPDTLESINFFRKTNISDTDQLRLNPKGRPVNYYPNRRDYRVGGKRFPKGG